MRVTEDLHHGDYRNVRTEDIDGTYESFVAMAQRSPYATAVTRAENVYLRKAYDDMMATGRGGFGWAWYIRN